MNDIDAQILTAKVELNRLTQEKERQRILELNNPEILMAEILHSGLCKCVYNHSVECGWGYGSWDNPRIIHREWLNKGISLKKSGFTIEQVRTFVNSIK